MAAEYILSEGNSNVELAACILGSDGLVVEVTTILIRHCPMVRSVVPDQFDELMASTPAS